MIMMLILSVVTWLVLVVVFEWIYGSIKEKTFEQFQKYQLCRLFWAVIALMLLTYQFHFAVCCLPLLFLVALAHDQLVRRNSDTQVHVQAVAVEMWRMVRVGWGRVASWALGRRRVVGRR